MIEPELIRSMFSNMKDEYGWDLSKPMVWGYFFTNKTPDELERAGNLLERDGYRVVDIFLSEKEDPAEPDLWWLHVEKVEVHTVESLQSRNEVLTDFASSNHLDSYDGMDVGPVKDVE